MTTKSEDPGALAGATGAEKKADRLFLEDSTEGDDLKAFPAQAAWRERNPVKVWAHSAVRSALRRGIIERKPCEACGDENSEAHHPNHWSPLDVQWLCRRHHKALHAGRIDHG